ncbi:PAS domain S-box protein [Variovorax sp. RT4R15]|uniref:PAS domain S-box protein n=1 Tax=Variovorax sp. RT4R15 TaxID=3443737 RepID=UPI003F47764E
MNDSIEVDTLLENPDAMIVLDASGSVGYWNAAAERLFGYSSAEAAGQHLDTLIVSPDQQDSFSDTLRAAEANGLCVEESVRCRKDGMLLHISGSTKFLPGEGQASHFILTRKDVTALKVVRETKLVNAMYGDLLEHAPDAILVVSVIGRVVLANSQACELFGYAAGALIGQPVEMLLPPRYSKIHRGRRVSFFTHPSTRDMGAGLELFGQRIDGEEFPVEIRISPLATEEGPMVMCAVRNITARQEARSKAERMFRELLESAPDAMVIVDATGKIVLINSQTIALFGWSQDELLGHSVDTLVPERFRHQHPAHRSTFTKLPKVRQMGAGRELFGLRKDGTEFPVEISLSSIQTNDGLLNDGLLIASTIRDVTKRKLSELMLRDANSKVEAASAIAEAEQAARQRVLETSLREKEVLLKEVHHRVKNNLQVISSLLQLQTDYLEAGETRRVFEQSQSRIRSMALVHEKLYQSKDLAQIDFGEYIRDLVSGLIGLHRSTVQIEIKADSLQLDVDRAIPFGLVLNELISNSFKHGFPDGRRGTISVQFSGGHGSPIELTVQDDGIGWPPNFDPARAPSMGLQLVYLMTAQLRGSLQVVNQNGICFTLTLAPEN